MQMALLFIDRECRFGKLCDQAGVQFCDQSCNQVRVQACNQARVQSCNQLSDRTCDLTRGQKALCETLREDLRWLVNFVEPLVLRPVSATLRKG